MRNVDRHLLLARILAARTVFYFSASLSVAYICVQVPQQASAQSLSSREYEIKAAYLYNFIKYVDWPSYGDTISIGVLGNDPFGPALAPLNGKMVKGRRLVTKHLDSVREAQQCQIIFVSSSEKQRLQEIFESLRSARVLTVGETQGFADGGGIINFIEENNKIRFEINAEAARRTGLNISSELLKLARLVKT
jgi:YfiR/HmsC-like